MRLPAHLLTTTVSIAALIAGLGMSTTPATALADEAADIKAGKELAFNRKKGNCLACHQIEGGTLPGNIGPPLVAMKARFPDRAKLKAQISDAREKNPNSFMPPFGPHEILTESEIDKITTFIHSL